MLVDVSVKGLTGKAVEAYLDEIGITVNKNAIPFDKQKPMVASGIRIGTPAITSRGFGATECREVARIIVRGVRRHRIAQRGRTPARTACTSSPRDTTFRNAMRPGWDEYFMQIARTVAHAGDVSARLGRLRAGARPPHSDDRL